MLREAGVNVAEMIAEGMPHGFYESGFGEITDAELAFLGDNVKRMVREGIIAEASQKCLEFVAEHF